VAAGGAAQESGASLPASFALDDSMAMAPGMNLSGVPARGSSVARISKSGQRDPPSRGICRARAQRWRTTPRASKVVHRRPWSGQSKLADDVRLGFTGARENEAHRRRVWSWRQVAAAASVPAGLPQEPAPRRRDARRKPRAARSSLARRPRIATPRCPTASRFGRQTGEPFGFAFLRTAARRRRRPRRGGRSPPRRRCRTASPAQMIQEGAFAGRAGERRSRPHGGAKGGPCSRTAIASNRSSPTAVHPASTFSMRLCAKRCRSFRRSDLEAPRGGARRAGALSRSAAARRGRAPAQLRWEGPEKSAGPASNFRPSALQR